MPASTATTRYFPESSVLVPTTEVANGEWPVFLLSDAVVYRTDGTTMANALLVNQLGPYTIRGRLEVDDDDDVQYLINPGVRTVNIEIQESKLYSIGYGPEAVIWLSGKAGWFEINPHPSYAKIYKDMCEVSHLDYVLAKIYSDELANPSRNSLASVDVKEVLFMYAVALGDGITYEETIDKCVRLGPALVSHMESSAGLPWKQTSIYAWLVRELKSRDRSRKSSSRDASHPPSAAPVPASIHRPYQETPVPVPALPRHASHSQPQSLPPQPLSNPLPFRASQAPGHAAATPRETPIPLPAHTAADAQPVSGPRAAGKGTLSDEDEAVFQLFLKTVEDIGREIGSQSRITAGKVHATLNQNFRLKEYNTGKSLSAIFCDKLLDSLSSAWHGSPYFAYLASDAAQVFYPKSPVFLRDVPGQLVRRNAGFPRFGSPASQLGLSQAGTYASQQTPRTAGKRAVLRPLVTAKKRPYDGAFGSEGGYDSDISMSRAGDAAAVASIPRPTIGRPRKTAKSVHDVSAAAPPASRTQTAPAPAFDDSSDSNDSSGEDSEVEGESETVVAVHAVPLEVSTRPTGPNGTWNCPHPGCHFLVRNAGTPENAAEDGWIVVDGDTSAAAARESIHAHLRSHEEQALSRVDLAITEGSRRHVSVDNLLAKIRALADHKAEPGRAGGPSRPAATAGVGTSSSTLRRFLY